VRVCACPCITRLHVCVCVCVCPHPPPTPTRGRARIHMQELYARVAVLTSENQELRRKVQELEGVHSTIEEAEEHSRQAKLANRVMDQRLSQQLERSP